MVVGARERARHPCVIPVMRFWIPIPCWRPQRRPQSIWCLSRMNRALCSLTALVTSYAGSGSHQQWLVRRLASSSPSEDQSLIMKWCTHWARSISRAENSQDQVISQSLFLQSVRRLHAIHTMVPALSSVQRIAASQHPENPDFQTPLDQLYMVVDICDSKRRPSIDDLLVSQTSEFFNTLPAYRALRDANTQHARLITKTPPPCSQVVENLMQDLSTAQSNALYYITTSALYTDYFFGVLGFETLRTRMLVESFESNMNHENNAFWRRHRDALLRPEMMACLKLTDWQRRVLLLPGADGHVLTNWQSLLFRSRVDPATARKGQDHVGLEVSEPQPGIFHDVTDGSLSTKARNTLAVLFGQIKKPSCFSFPPRIASPAAAVSPKAVSLIDLTSCSTPTH